ncbi:MAG TPA: LysM peptidoglycan-binding domain-containing protein [Flavobacterium sp.]|jgi:LysM repeat protein
MTFSKTIILGSLFWVSVAFSQTNYKKHVVTKGETITQVAAKYKIAPADIYRLNPDSKNGLKPDMVLLIPADATAKVKEAPKPLINKIKVQSHTVAAKETIYGLAKMYNITTQDLENANPEIKTEGLKVGSVIKIPGQFYPGAVKKETVTANKPEDKKIKKPDTKNSEPVYHVVLAKETKYSIAKQYNISIEELEKNNPEIKEGLDIGFKLKIHPGATQSQAPAAPKEIKAPTPVTVIPPPVTTPSVKENLVDYQVKPKETLYGLARKTGLTEEELLKINPDLKENVREGMVIRIPSSAKMTEPVETNLLQGIKTQNKKQMVMLLPFNISKIQADTANTLVSKLKTEKFLNMTLDFYSGALMAIDSAKALGLNVDIKILDSQETRNSSNVATLIEQNNITNADVVVGPFYQANVEKTAELLNKSNVKVVSPLSKDTGQLYGNLIQSMPSNEIIKETVLNYMRGKSGNILAIIDPKKLSTKIYITENHKDVKLVGLSDKGLVLDSIVKKLSKTKMNYVIFDSEKTDMVLKTTGMLSSLMNNYQIQLVILEKNPTLDFEEIKLPKLTKLKMLFPSIIKENLSPEGAIFERKYREKNKIVPSQYATRGFDITFDILLRLSQEKSFDETFETVVSEQVENKFQYQKTDSGAYINKGVYVLYYDTDLSVKEAN